MENLTRPDLDSLKENRKLLLRIDRELSAMTEGREYLFKAVEEAASSLRLSLGRKELASIPVSELALSKAGIRVSALEKAGISDLSQLAGRSQDSLECIEGIGEVQAKAIRETLYIFEQRLSETVALRISAEDRFPENDALILALYRYIKSEPISNDGRDLYDRYHGAIQRADELTKIKNPLHWIFSTRSSKEATIEASDIFASLLLDPFPQRAINLLSQYSALCECSVEEALSDFEKNSPGYYVLLERLGQENASLSNIYSDISTPLIREISEERLDTSLLKVTLRSYQEFGVRFILHQKKVLLGDEMGLGKTVMAIAAMSSVAAGSAGPSAPQDPGISGSSAGSPGAAAHFLVVCPASVLVNWCREVEKHSALKAFLLHGKHRKGQMEDWLRKGGVAVTNYESADEFVEELPSPVSPGLLVVDEAHYIKNPDAKRTVYIKKIMEMSSRILLMTGTPLENRVEEMCSLVGTLRPDIVPELEKYAILRNTDEFKKILAPVYLRRVRKDVLKELPDITEKSQWLEMSSEDTASYIEAVESRNFMAMRRVSWLQADMKHSSKAVRFMELCDQARDEDRKIVAFSFFRETLEKVSSLLGERCAGVIGGNIPAAQRQGIVDDFSNSPEGSVLACQIVAGGTGLNIQAASVVIFCEPQIKPSLEKQALSRVYRMGQVRSVLVYHLLCSETVDESMEEMLSEKQREFDDYADESEAAEAAGNLNENEWIHNMIERERMRYLPAVIPQ
ncbi:MAG: DEAD/DEAH box helicase [Lachnospiraceae bacterium]|nr:DEAD/DEAH box helicase [Lachnospiraceae bacterium]